jgi:hypothetical protein
MAGELSARPGDSFPDDDRVTLRKMVELMPQRLYSKQKLSVCACLMATGDNRSRRYSRTSARLRRRLPDGRSCGLYLLPQDERTPEVPFGSE